MNPLSLICLFGILFFEVFPAWNIQDIGTIRSQGAISMNHSGLGFMLSDSDFLFKSIDTGKNWIEIRTGFPEVNHAIGIISASKIILGGRDGVFILSLDTGRTWEMVNVPIRNRVELKWVRVNKIFFKDSLEGYILGTFFPPLRTKDGGNLWEELKLYDKNDSQIISDDFSAIQFIDSITGYLANKGEIFKSLDGGNSWKLLAKPGWPGFEEWDGSYGLTDFCFISSDTGFFVAPYYSAVLKTTDGLMSINRIGGMPTNAIHFSNKKRGAIAGYDGIYQTEDGGLTWPKVFDGDSLNGGRFDDIYFFSDSLAYAVGSNGLFVKYSPGGISIEKKTGVKSRYPAKFAFRQNSPNPLNFSTRVMYDLPMAGGQYGQYYVSVSVYNTKGQKVRSLVNKSQQPGSYAIEWDGSDDSGTRLPAGEYLLKMKAGDFSATRKVVLLK